MASAIYSPSEIGVMQEFGVNVQLASMGLSMCKHTSIPAAGRALSDSSKTF